MENREYRHKLLDAIERRAQCSAVHIQTQPVRLALDGQILWKGKVEVFQLKEHPEAKLAFGWGVPNGQGQTEFITVIGRPPLDNPISAVKAYLASKNRG